MPTRWDDNDAFWEDMRAIVFRAERRDAALREAELIIERLGLTTGDALLDIPCGIGRHSIELAKHGIRVTGIDRYRPYLDEAAERAKALQLDGEFIRADMREFVRDAAFDAAINMYTSFGYFESHADEMRVLANVYRSLRPGGSLLMEMAGKEIIARNFQPKGFFELEDGSIGIEHRTVEGGWRSIRTRLTLIRTGDGRRFEHEIEVRCFSAQELTTMLERAGFVGCETYGSLEGEPYDQNAKRLVVLARKSA